MEVPVAANGSLLVPLNYVSFLCEEANSRLAENFSRIMKLEHRFRETSLTHPNSLEMNTLRCNHRQASLDLNEKVAVGAGHLEKNCQEDAEFLDFVDSLFPED